MKHLPTLLLIAALAALAPPSTTAPPSASASAIGDSGADARHRLVSAGIVVEPAESDAVGGVTLLPGRPSAQSRRAASLSVGAGHVWAPKHATPGLPPHLRDRILHPSTAPPQHV